jgi:FtsP/CotA-like multicopper oxidase with cupredoxin domain
LEVIAGITVLAFSMVGAAQSAGQTPLAGEGIPQFVDPLPGLSVKGGAITVVDGTQPVTLSMCEFQANVLPTGTFAPGVKPLTWVWGYVPGRTCPTEPRGTYIGPVIVASRGTPTEVTFLNQLGSTATTHALAYKNSVDQTLHWADPFGQMCQMSLMPGMLPEPPCDQPYDGPIPAVVHLHGGEIPAVLDGGPDAWFTSDGQIHGPAYYTRNPTTDPANGAVYRYPNSQEAGPVWFHDHTLGATRLNVYMGLAGAYILQDPAQKLPTNLTPLTDIIPLVIQDRMFDTDGQLYFPADPLNPEHPSWVPEFLGDTIAVNGKVWPYTTVEPKRYRFLILNGSNARSYTLAFNVPARRLAPIFWQIGTDGGYLDWLVPMQSLTLMPGERAEVIIDFSLFLAGDRLTLTNSANAPLPSGDPVDPLTTAKVMQFRVGQCTSGKCRLSDRSYNPLFFQPLRKGAQRIQRLVDPRRGVPVVPIQETRQLTLNEVVREEPITVDGRTFDGGPLEILVNNTTWAGAEMGKEPRPDFVPVTVGGQTLYLSETPAEGDTEVWEFVNLTMDTHPMHLHLVQFQVLNRQAFDAMAYEMEYGMAFPSGEYQPGYGPPLDYFTGNPRALGGNPDVTPFLQGKPIPPARNEAGWKDTVQAPPGFVTRIAVRWAPTDTPTWKRGSYLFDPNALGYGYVWHCHIVDHEDNEMMRPDIVIPNPDAVRSILPGRDF